MDDKGSLKVVSVDMAVDCGPQVDPERIRSQVEGAVVVGLSLAIHSELTFKVGRAVQSNFHDYVVLCSHKTQRDIRVHLAPSDHSLPPGGSATS